MAARTRGSLERRTSVLLCENRAVLAVATFGGKIKKCDNIGRSGRPAAIGTCRSIETRKREARCL